MRPDTECQPTIARFSESEWAARAADLIQREIDVALRTKKACSVMLTGGRSARRLYESWAAMPQFQRMRGVSFYFGDERCVPEDSPESNQGMAMRTLFRGGVPAGCLVLPIEAGRADTHSEAACYGDKLPAEIDVLLLGVGEDGHVASLFPGSPVLRERQRRVVPVRGPAAPRDRLTITPIVIEGARNVFVLAPGRAKERVLSLIMDGTDRADALPARLVAGAVWLLDTTVMEESRAKAD